MNQKEKYMGDLENKKGNFLCDLTSKAHQQSLQKPVSDVCHQVEFSESLSNNKENQCHENANELYFNDEESMIPKGLLDQPYDKSEEHYFNEVTTSTTNTNMLSYGIPCYIAVFPQPADRPITNYNQFNGQTPYFPSEPAYVYPPGGDYILQSQRDVRTFNNPLYNRNYQGMDYNWWSHGRQNHIPYIPNTNVEIRQPNIQRNLGLTIADRYYDPQQIIHEHPYEYHRDLGYKAHFSYGVDNSYLNPNCPQPSFSKSFCRNQNKYRREFHQMHDGNLYLKNSFVHEIPTTPNINHGINGTNISIPKHVEINNNSPEHDQLMSYLNVHNIKYKSNDLNTFKKIALEGCLQLEKLLATNNNKSCAKNLEELCRTVKSQLSHSMNTIQTELIIRELILGFLHICNSWICISSIITMKQGHNNPYESSLQALLIDFENWQNTSKTLLEKLLVAVQEISLEHEQYIKDIYRGTANKGIVDTEKVQNDLHEFKTDIYKDFKQKQCNVSAISSFNNEGYNMKQNSTEWSEPEKYNSLMYCEKHNSFTYNVPAPSAELQNIQQNISSEFNQNITHEYLNTKPQTLYHTQGIFSSINLENVSTESINVENDVNKGTDSEQKTSFPLIKKNNPSSKEDMVSCKASKHIISVSVEKEYPSDKENTERNTSTVQPEMLNIMNSTYDNNNLKNDSVGNHKILMEPEINCKEEEENQIHSRTNNEVNQNYQFAHDRFNPKYNRKKSLKNKICNFSKNYSKSAESGMLAEQIINIKTYSKSKLQDIFSAIQGADLEKFVTQRISDNDITKIRQSITYPLFSISYSVNKDCYQNLNDVLDDLYKLFFKAKCENKGNITLLTVANRLELKLINMMFEEIGIC